jgi:hypothetical protein
MSNIPVRFINFDKESPERGYWDQNFLEKIFSRPEFEILHQDLDAKKETSILIIPGSQNIRNIDEINRYIKDFGSILLIITGNEESLFQVEKLEHPNMKLWLMVPHPGKNYPNVNRFFGFNHTPHTNLLPNEAPDKKLRWFFAGQITHSRREKCVEQLRKLQDGKLIETKGFAKGIPVEKYIKIMSESKVIPCPGAPVTPDTFRFYEALEAACIPIVDEFSASSEEPGYWQLIFGENIPFPIIKDFKELPDLITYFNDTFTVNSNKIFAWWQMYKRNFINNLIDDYNSIAPDKFHPEKDITAIIPTSPTLSNPDTSIIEETIKSIRVHHPNCEIIITFDGVRPEQENRRENYNEYIRQVLWKINRQYKNIVPIVFEKHTHQVGMLREALKIVRTGKILYCEHDTPITPDLPIEWEAIYSMLDSKEADLIRLHFEAFIPEPHHYLMINLTPRELFGAKFVKTVQWSQRPHVASVEFYNRILADHFTPEALTFVEDKMHGVVIDAYKREQLQGWNKYKLWIYHPDGGNIKRSYHLDGRGAEEKFTMIF